MTAGLETFAKVRALHDRTDSPGEKASAAGRMEALAEAAGMTVAEAVSKLDAPAPKPSSFFEDLFNTPEFRADRAEREAKRQTKAAALVEEYGSEDAVFADTPMEAALRSACEPLLGPGETWQARHEIDGWGSHHGRSTMPASVREAVSEAWPLPSTIAEAWAEYEASEKLIGDRYTVDTYCDPWVFVNARRYVVEELCNTLPARSLNDLRARISWMEFWANGEIEQTPDEHRTNLATLRADIERMGARLKEEAASVQNGQGADRDQSKSGSTSPVQNGRPEGMAEITIPLRRTNAEKRRDVLALLNAGIPGISALTDREIARRAGVSPQTVGNIRRSLA
ncbi:hypothetical protein [Methylobacterium flocculans]|uniref:hypothetical protein n=1 Tax=Methylobacterium flocculans TaxID=2984843 RepID=UPI0021F289FE|nr:hypothetical protein [Methylobacterium sp. FF17]